MIEVPLWIVALIGVALFVVIYIEASEYRKYVKAAKALTAFAEGMKITFEQMGEHMNRMATVQNVLVMEAESKDRELQAMNLVLASHTEALSIKLLTELVKGANKDVQRD